MKKLCCLLLLLRLAGFVNAQSTIQVKNTRNHSFDIILENATHYFEESGSNISIANLEPGTYYLKIWDPFFAEASAREMTIAIKTGQKIIITVQAQMQLDMTTETLKTKTGTVAKPPVAVRPQPPVQRLPRMKEADAKALAAAINGKPFDNEKEAIFRAGTKYNSFTTAQVRDLIISFNFGSNKLNMAKLVFPQVTDKQNYHQLKDCFTFLGEQNDFMKFLNQQ
ncbi:DUF4476 domain-containing protein [Niabella drilacis]|uniref:DUF4476 domain-containing protein n=1 Tax=Niabella drilacis (strain DSM 25811 / CCM 8410 / CCUG 62505 / LMG 26954 / E90) TaxID=1285928 RepID=A0A1G6PS12_NIADE|nr:DUF4476 domain-containing protein [Niabella drilacis]SDC82751.1 protein of unknown function [Niabella drilacis]